MLFELLATNAIVTFALLFVLWLLSIVLRDVSIVDPFWGFGFVVVAWFSWLFFGASTPRTILIVTLVSLWGFRLSGYLLWRNMGHEEDRRYAAMREKRGNSFWWKSLFIVFWLQAGLLWLISIPIQISATDMTTGLTWIDFLGIAVFSIGLFFETVGDWQLAQFKADPTNRGKVLDHGLWGLTRHPNYFGDFCVWWGIYFIALAAGAGWTIFSPAIMSFLLLKVSGVSLLESDIEERRPGYREYVNSTNAFFPGPKRNSTEST